MINDVLVSLNFKQKLNDEWNISTKCSSNFILFLFATVNGDKNNSSKIPDDPKSDNILNKK